MKETKSLVQNINDIVNNSVNDTIKNDRIALFSIKSMAYYNFIKGSYFNNEYNKSKLKQDINGLIHTELKTFRSLFLINSQQLPYTMNMLTESKEDVYRNKLSTFILNEKQLKIISDYKKLFEKSNSFHDLINAPIEITEILRDYFPAKHNPLIKIMQCFEPEGDLHQLSNILPKTFCSTIQHIKSFKHDKLVNIEEIKKELSSLSNSEFKHLLKYDQTTHLLKNDSKECRENILNAFSDPMYKKTHLGIILENNSSSDKLLNLLDKLSFKKIKTEFLNDYDSIVNPLSLEEYNHQYATVLETVQNTLKNDYHLLCNSNYEVHEYSRNKSTDEFNRQSIISDELIENVASSFHNHLVTPNFSRKSYNDLEIDVDDIELFENYDCQNVHLKFYRNELECNGVVKLLEKKIKHTDTIIIEFDIHSFVKSQIKNEDLLKIYKNIIDEHKNKIIIFNNVKDNDLIVNQLIEDKQDSSIILRHNSHNMSDLGVNGELRLDKILADFINFNDLPYEKLLDIVNTVKIEIKNNKQYDKFFSKDPMERLKDFNIKETYDLDKEIKDVLQKQTHIILKRNKNNFKI